MHPRHLESVQSRGASRIRSLGRGGPAHSSHVPEGPRGFSNSQPEWRGQPGSLAVGEDGPGAPANDRWVTDVVTAASSLPQATSVLPRSPFLVPCSPQYLPWMLFLTNRMWEQGGKLGSQAPIGSSSTSTVGRSYLGSPRADQFCVLRGGGKSVWPRGTSCFGVHS